MAERNYSGATRKVTVVKPVNFTHSDYEKEVFRVGTYPVPVEVADNDYFRHHTDDPPVPLPAPGTAEFNHRLAQEAATSRAAIARRQAEEATARNLRESLDPAKMMELARPQLEAALRAEITPRITAEVEERLRAELGPVLRAEADALLRPQLEAALREEIEASVRAEMAAVEPPAKKGK